MEFLELVKRRCSVRKYKSGQVEKEKLNIILEAGRVAPSGKNAQPQRVIVVREKEGLEKIKKAANIFEAPLVIIVCGDHESVWVRPYDGKTLLDIDVSIVTDHMMLAATALGLGSVWICNFKPEIIRQEFNLPQNIEPINILAIGYADGPVASSERHDEKRKPISNTVFYEKLENQ